MITTDHWTKNTDGSWTATIGTFRCSIEEVDHPIHGRCLRATMATVAPVRQLEEFFKLADGQSPWLAVGWVEAAAEWWDPMACDECGTTMTPMEPGTYTARDGITYQTECTMCPVCGEGEEILHGQPVQT